MQAALANCDVFTGVMVSVAIVGHLVSLTMMASTRLTYAPAREELVGVRNAEMRMNDLGSAVRLLVVDHDGKLGEIAGSILSDTDFTVQTVAGSAAAVAACATRPPDVVLLDLEMPDSDAYRTCTNVRALPGGAELHIVVAASCGDTHALDRGYQAGATDFIVKPIDWTVLGHRLRYALRGARTKQAQARIHRLAYFDGLTGLPNREWIHEYLAQSLQVARQLNRSLALLYVDLDQFKRINDTLGHETGDALLRQVAEKLQARLNLDAGAAELAVPSIIEPIDAARPERIRGQLARVGGDEFIVVLTGRTDVVQAQTVSRKILSILAAPFQQGSYELVVTPSIGIAMYPEHGVDAQSLLKNADGAMYEAKASGRNRLRIYDSAMSVRALKRLSLEMELRRAVENSSLDLYYQPKYQASTLQLLGGEALLRWFHPDRGQIPTADFIAVAEETGLIGDIGRWAVQRVCRDLCQWREQGMSLPRIAVNVSGRDFMYPEALLRLGDTVTQARLSPSLLELELSEGVLMRDPEAGRRSLLTLKEFGFALAVDDFGTGYCSLRHLQRFPIDTLKIDRAFVAGVSDDPDHAAMVRAIIALGHSLHLKIVAEGVTTPAQLKFLQAESCDAVQGYLMSPAVPSDVFRDLWLHHAASGEGFLCSLRKVGSFTK
jgi:diguanylate cyclase